jgi:hypothetical protein
MGHPEIQLNHVDAHCCQELLPGAFEPRVTTFSGSPIAVRTFYIHENVRGGVAYLAELQELFHGDLRLVMAGYATGEGPVLARGLDYSSQEVYTYVQRIGQQYRAE